jgi:hypothetical protein
MSVRSSAWPPSPSSWSSPWPKKTPSRSVRMCRLWSASPPCFRTEYRSHKPPFPLAGPLARMPQLHRSDADLTGDWLLRGILAVGIQTAMRMMEALGGTRVKIPTRPRMASVPCWLHWLFEVTKRCWLRALSQSLFYTPPQATNRKQLLHGMVGKLGGSQERDGPASGANPYAGRVGAGSFTEEKKSCRVMRSRHFQHE